MNSDPCFWRLKPRPHPVFFRVGGLRAALDDYYCFSLSKMTNVDFATKALLTEVLASMPEDTSRGIMLSLGYQ